MKTMTKILSTLALVVGLVLPGVAHATRTTASEQKTNEMVVWTIAVPSQAQNAIDTTYAISIADLSDWDSTNGRKLSLQFAGASGVDSTNTAIQVSLDGTTWLAVYALANDGSNLTTTTPMKTLTITNIARFLRVISKNVDATTGTATIRIGGKRP